MEHDGPGLFPAAQLKFEGREIDLGWLQKPPVPWRDLMCDLQGWVWCLQNDTIDSCLILYKQLYGSDDINYYS